MTAGNSVNCTRASLRLATAIAVAAAALSLSDDAHAAYKIGDEESYLKIGALLQTWAAVTDNAAPDGGMEKEFYLRRMRLMVSGQTNEMVNFFFETDNPNFGKGGNWDGNTYIQDAWVELNLDRALQLDAGMLLVPFSHHGMQGATSLLTLDYHSALLRYPTGSNKVWRDAGVMARGLLFSDMVEYRLGVFNGVHGSAKTETVTKSGLTWTQPTDPRNPSDWPRVAARVTLNAFDAEGGPGAGGFFYDGLYLQRGEDGLTSPKKVLSLGFSFDWQKDLNPDWGQLPASNGGATPVRPIEERTDYYAAAADLFWDLPLDEARQIAWNGQINAVYFNYGDRKNPGAWLNEVDAKGDRSQFTGHGVMAETGVRYHAIEPVVAVDWYDSTKAEEHLGDYLAVYGGLNYWLYGHDTSIKVQGGASKAHGADWTPAGIAQLQFLF